MTAVDDWLGTSMNAPSKASEDPVDAWLGGGAPQPAASAPVVAAAPDGQPAPLGGFLTGVGDVAKGTTQGIVHGLSWVADRVAPNSQFAKDARAALPEMQQTIDQQNAAYEQARMARQPQNLSGLITGQKPDPGIDWGRLAGNALGTVPTMLIGPEFAAASLPAKIGLGAAQGAAGALMMPTTGNSDQSYAQQKLTQAGLGAGLGATLPAAFAGTRALGSNLWNAIKPVIQPGKFVGEGLAGALNPQDAGAAAANIRTAPTFVQGSAPTTAQAAPSPVLVATEKAAANDNPDFKIALTARENANNQARWDALNQIARTPADLDAAIAAREAAAGPAYQAARAQTYPVDADLTDLMERPAMQDALARGITIARNEGNQGLVPAVQAQAAQHANVPTGGVGFNGQPLFQQILTRPATQGQPAQISGDVLHYLKLGMDDLQNSARENTRLGPSERTAINTAQKDFLGWLDNTSTDYAHARQAYAANSPPVNTMEAAQQMAERLGGLNKALNTSGTPLVTAPGYATALGQALRSQEFGIDPAAQQSLENIGRDLQRSTISNSLRSGSGSDTAYNLSSQGWLARNLYGPGFEGATGMGKAAASAATALAGHPIAALGVYGTANRLGQAVGNRLQQRLGSYLLDPQALLPYLDARAAVPAGQALPGPIVKGLLNYGRPAVVNGLLGGFINTPQ
ncbi:hypothetical protein [Paraburkholderia sp. SIMBA_054]|uniref:hypothetical protein n=2 Tax=unclassified Paraburkholderia TaxID=2615204 RepID=UPI00397C70D4